MKSRIFVFIVIIVTLASCGKPGQTSNRGKQKLRSTPEAAADFVVVADKKHEFVIAR